MKNLLKLSLLLSAFVVGGLNATQIEVAGQNIRIPDQITLVNDLGVALRVADISAFFPGNITLNSKDLKRLNGSIRVEKPNGEVGYITYQTIPAGYQGNVMELWNPETRKLSEAFALEAR